MPVLVAIALGCLLSCGSIWTAGLLATRSVALPWSVRYMIGTAVYSLLIFGLLLGHAGFAQVFWLLGGLLGVAAWRFPAARWIPQASPSSHRIPSLICVGILTLYTGLYLVYAFAPEIQPDAIAYHLRIVADYVRAHGFTGKSAFFDVMPQPVEMLFVPAFSVGAHSAAKLVHLSLLVSAAATVREIARELGLADASGWSAAVLFFVAPVCGVAGSAAYTDAGLAAATFSVVYLLVRWDRTREPWLLAFAGMDAALCYAVKQTFGWVAVVAFVFIAVRGRTWLRPIAFAAGVLALAAPWMIRAYILTGNPVAPFLSASGLDTQLARTFSAFRPGFDWMGAIWNYTVHGGNQGVVGPLFLLLPLAFLGIRRRATVWMLLAAVLLALPILANTGTRFLMPMLGPAAIAMVSVLPAPAAVAIAVLQAAAAWPDAVDLYAKDEWRLGELPWEAALRLEPEKAHLERMIPGFAVTHLIERETLPGSRILTFTGVPEAYMDREFLTYWQSGAGSRLSDGLIFALDSEGGGARTYSWRTGSGVEVVAGSEFRVVDARPASNLAWTNHLPGESFRFQLPGDLVVWPSDARITFRGPAPTDGPEFRIDLRRDATAAIRKSGYKHILIPIGDGPFAPLGRDLLQHADEWGVRPQGVSGDRWLFQISQ